MQCLFNDAGITYVRADFNDYQGENTATQWIFFPVIENAQVFFALELARDTRLHGMMPPQGSRLVLASI
jgi:hypothetical protein